MIRVVVSYPTQTGSRFDLEYYLNQHIPMVHQKLEPHGLTGTSVDQGIGGGAPGSPARYQIQCHLNFATMEGMQAGLSAEGAALMADIPNFTDVRPEMQINRVVR
ncbi:MAG TPA: EthD family reductase [Bryobacteraceae bacterium]|jgi:uncharacterized protein (TIGR02118 family)|nr:EthD family reductase [Bryobacteraceae bacterium]